jgi:hypothetical protein
LAAAVPLKAANNAPPAKTTESLFLMIFSFSISALFCHYAKWLFRIQRVNGLRVDLYYYDPITLPNIHAEL